MGLQARLDEVLNQAGTIQCVSATNTYYTDAISLDSDQGRHYMAYVNVGTLGANGTVDFSIVGSATSGGTYAALSTAVAITQDTTGGKTHQVCFAVDKVKANNSTVKYVKGKLIIGTAATPCAVVVVGADPAHLPVTNNTANAGQNVTYY